MTARDEARAALAAAEARCVAVAKTGSKWGWNSFQIELVAGRDFQPTSFDMGTDPIYLSLPSVVSELFSNAATDLPLFLAAFREHEQELSLLTEVVDEKDERIEELEEDLRRERS